MRLAFAIVLGEFFLILAAWSCGVPLLIYWEPYSALCVFGGTAAILAAAFPGTHAMAALRGEATPEAVAFLRLGRRTAWYLGIATFVIGLVALLYALADPSMIGRSAALALLSLLYASLLAEGVSGLFLPQRHP